MFRQQQVRIVLKYMYGESHVGGYSRVFHQQQVRIVLKTEVTRLELCLSVHQSVTPVSERFFCILLNIRMKVVNKFLCTCINSHRSSSTFVTADLLLHELLPFVKNLFSAIFLADFANYIYCTCDTFWIT